MAVPPAHSPPSPVLDLADDPLRQVRRLIARQLFAVASVVALLTAAMFAMLPAQLAKDGRWPLVLAFGALGLLAAGSMGIHKIKIECIDNSRCGYICWRY
ncbi:MAG: hypothetical protein J0L57_02465 [Burkholderiales bacterium]|nr:hypothetical protein [Burkholderiales bacterium]